VIAINPTKYYFLPLSRTQHGTIISYLEFLSLGTTHLSKVTVARFRTSSDLNMIHHHHHHHQPINASSAEAQAFLVDYSLGERAITHHAAQCGLVVFDPNL
jgi:hypothetical protein